MLQQSSRETQRQILIQPPQPAAGPQAITDQQRAGIHAVLAPLRAAPVQTPVLRQDTERENSQRTLRLQHAILGNPDASNALGQIRPLTPQETQQLGVLIANGYAQQQLRNLLIHIGQTNGPEKQAQYVALARAILAPTNNTIPATREMPVTPVNRLDAIKQEPWYIYLNDRINHIEKISKDRGIPLNANAAQELPALHQAFARLVRNTRLPLDIATLVQSYMAREKSAVQNLMSTLPVSGADRDAREATLAAHLRAIIATENYIATRIEKSS